MEVVRVCLWFSVSVLKVVVVVFSSVCLFVAQRLHGCCDMSVGCPPTDRSKRVQGLLLLLYAIAGNLKLL